jgi:serine/threonine protein kinase
MIPMTQDDMLVLELIRRWEEGQDQGKVISPEELCASCPHLLDKVKQAIGELRQIAPLLQGAAAGEGSQMVNQPLATGSKDGQVPKTGPDAPLGIVSTAQIVVDDALLGCPTLTGYEILGESGRGGMGVVYRARHKVLGRQVAIKVMLPGAAVKRFLREARLLASIKSPYLITVHDFGVLPNGCPVLVMEWVEGQNLHRLIQTQRGLLREDEALVWMRHICEGMQAAADKGIIHRDLKPSNVLIDSQGQARVADFGLARGPASLGDLSQFGQVMGTPYYMAPEQAEDPHSVDTRADIYSFGATFYHALTGRPPFEGQTAFSVLYKHKTEPLVSPRARRWELSDRTSELLERCLAKAPSDRFASFAEILKHLRPASELLSPWAASEDTEIAPYLARYRPRREFYLVHLGRIDIP